MTLHCIFKRSVLAANCQISPEAPGADAAHRGAWGLIIFFVFTSNRANKLQEIFNSVGSIVCTSRSSLFSFLKDSNNFTSRFAFLFCAFVFQIILNRRIVGNKSFLVHVFKLKRKSTSTLAKDLKSESLNEITLWRLTRQKTWDAAPDWTYPFLHTWKKWYAPSDWLSAI